MTKPTTTPAAKFDLYQTVTDKIIATLEAGAGDWNFPWRKLGVSSVQPVNIASKKAYRGINTIMLFIAAESNGFTSNVWGTFAQFKALGNNSNGLPICVRKGEKGTTVVFWKTFEADETSEGSDEENKTSIMARAYTVFNAAQIENYEPTTITPIATTELERIEAVETYIENTRAIIRHGGNRACYSMLADYIKLPQPEQFISKEAYAATALHELTHWTGHHARCNREFGKRFGDHAYAAEEMVAELGSAYICATLNIENNKTLPDHAAYLASWLKILKSVNVR